MDTPFVQNRLGEYLRGHVCRLSGEFRTGDRFAALSYARKVLLSCTCMNRSFVFTYDFPFLPLEQPVPGLILLYDGITGRRLLDRFDYPAFLRDGAIRAAKR